MVMSEISYARGHGLAPEVDLGIAVWLNQQNRHAFSRPHRSRVEQELLVEWKLVGRRGRAARQKR
jgi:hypothetical protein